MPVTEATFLQTLRQGAVYYIPTRVKSPNYHFCIVMNENPTLDNLVLLEIITSKVDKTKRLIKLQKHYDCSAVEMGPSTVPFLHQPSIVNCNSYLDIPKDLLVEDMKNPRSYHAGQLPQDLLEKIIAGSMSSTGVRPEQKRRISKVRAEHLEKVRDDMAKGIMPSAEIKITVSRPPTP